MTQEKIYTLPEFAQALQITKEAARDLLWSRQVSYRKIGGRLRIWQSDLDEYLRRTRIPARDEVSAA